MSVARVLHVITMLELGGAQRNTLDTCRLLDRERIAVGLACADEGELLPEARCLEDVRLYELPSLRREVRPWLDAGHECWIVDVQHEHGEHRDGNLVRWHGARDTARGASFHPVTFWRR